MDVSVASGVRFFASAFAVATLIDMYAVQQLRRFGGVVFEADLARRNRIWDGALRPVAQAAFGPSAIEALRVRTLLFPLVELLFAGGVVTSLYVLGSGGAFARTVVFLSIAVPLGLINWQDRTSLAPNAITYPGIAIGVAVSLIPGAMEHLGAAARFAPEAVPTWLGEAALALAAALLGAAVVFVVLLVVSLVARGGFGMGAVKAGAMVGAFVGLGNVAIFLLLSFMVGAVGATYLMFWKRLGSDAQMPFVHIQMATGFIVMLWGSDIWTWWTTL